MATTIETANTILKERNSFAAIAYINSLGEMQAMEAYHDLALHLYNEEHDVGGLVTVSRAHPVRADGRRVAQGQRPDAGRASAPRQRGWPTISPPTPGRAGTTR